jgi:hypothetical protein
MIKQGVLAVTVATLCACAENPTLITIDSECDYVTVKTTHGHQDRMSCSSARVVDRTHTAQELDDITQQRGAHE